MKKILLNGPLLSQSGYGKQARFALEALKSRPDEFDIYVAVTSWGKTSWLPRDSEESKDIHQLLTKTKKFTDTFDIHLQVGIPNEIKKFAPINILYTAGIETTSVSAQWIQLVNTIDRVITVSSHSKNTFENAAFEVYEQDKKVGLLRTNIPVDYVSYPVPNEKIKNGRTLSKPSFETSTTFNFLSVAQWGPRKNMDMTIAGFMEEFRDNSDVGLILKTSIANQSIPDKFKLRERLDKIKKQFPDSKCKLYLVHGDMTDSEIDTEIYGREDVKCLVNIAHGEGFGLPMFEAAYNGIPVLTHGWSGPADFLVMDSKPKFVPVPMFINQLQPEHVWGDILIKEAGWAYVNKEDYMASLRKLYNNFEEYELKAKELQLHLNKNFTEEKTYGMFVSQVLGKTAVEQHEVEQWLQEITEYE
jgi:glycosyltransferase involved in cell wall biosynthesis